MKNEHMIITSLVSFLVNCIGAFCFKVYINNILWWLTVLPISVLFGILITYDFKSNKKEIL